MSPDDPLAYVYSIVINGRVSPLFEVGVFNDDVEALEAVKEKTMVMNGDSSIRLDLHVNLVAKVPMESLVAMMSGRAFQEDPKPKPHDDTPPTGWVRKKPLTSRKMFLYGLMLGVDRFAKRLNEREKSKLKRIIHKMSLTSREYAKLEKDVRRPGGRGRGGSRIAAGRRRGVNAPDAGVRRGVRVPGSGH